ncbi:SDR family NAD(P)-dependent oxidoreductase [Rhizobium laguerreae]|uniref:SDR family NAD(P)-dependent oxidoreductase n=1 Tax=Rhizobium laguerreae TaxID=1076926 RepID=UPI001FEE7255|nr:SDR family oxidoreductase [Rhizobium laguerreae]
MTFANDLFADRTVVIPGGTSGIGAATAHRFAELGARVVCCGLGASSGPRSERIESREINVLQPDALADFFATLDRIDVLVNCTGISRDRDEWKKETFDEVIAINLTSVMDCCRLGRSRMKSGSSIINIASMYSTFGAADRPGYFGQQGSDRTTDKVAGAGICGGEYPRQRRRAGLDRNAAEPGIVCR